MAPPMPPANTGLVELLNAGRSWYGADYQFKAVQRYASVLRSTSKFLFTYTCLGRLSRLQQLQHALEYLFET
jgi:hypothetical protein